MNHLASENGGSISDLSYRVGGEYLPTELRGQPLSQSRLVSFCHDFYVRGLSRSHFVTVFCPWSVTVSFCLDIFCPWFVTVSLCHSFLSVVCHSLTLSHFVSQSHFVTQLKKNNCHSLVLSKLEFILNKIKCARLVHNRKTSFRPL